jgi:hypothetical protein
VNKKKVLKKIGRALPLLRLLAVMALTAMVVTLVVTFSLDAY